MSPPAPSSRNCGEPISCEKTDGARHPAWVQRLWLLTPLANGPLP